MTQTIRNYDLAWYELKVRVLGKHKYWLDLTRDNTHCAVEALREVLDIIDEIEMENEI